MIEKENIIIVTLIMKKSHYMDPNAILQTLQHLSMSRHLLLPKQPLCNICQVIGNNVLGHLYNNQPYNMRSGEQMYVPKSRN